MKNLKLLTSFFFICAIIRSSEVKNVDGYHIHYRGLCVNFDIVESTNQSKILESSHQCDVDWDGIDKGIRWQLKEYEIKVKEDRESKDNETRLQAIKNDQVGHIIR